MLVHVLVVSESPGELKNICVIPIPGASASGDHKLTNDYDAWLGWGILALLNPVILQGRKYSEKRSGPGSSRQLEVELVPVPVLLIPQFSFLSISSLSPPKPLFCCGTMSAPASDKAPKPREYSGGHSAQVAS